MPLQEKLNEKSVESDLFDFLDAFESAATEVPHAFTGGLAFGAYFGHLPRRMSDIDMVITSEGAQALETALSALGFTRVSTSKQHVIHEYASQEHFFEIDVHLDRIVLALPYQWRVVGEYDLRPALSSRRRLTLKTLDGSRSLLIPVVPEAEHFMMKLLPPLESHNVHDLAYLVAATGWDSATEASTIQVARRHGPELRRLLAARLHRVRGVFPSTIWAATMTADCRSRINRVFDNVLRGMA